MSFKHFFVGRRSFGLGFMAAFLGTQKAGAATNQSKDKELLSFKGTLYPIGGAADTSLGRFVELAGGSSARIVILPHSSSTPKETAEELANSFMALGVKDTETIMPGEKKSLPKCSAVFMSGGDQSRMMRLIDQAFIDELRAFLQEGHLIGGTSAGAAIMAPRMIAGGMSDGLPKSKSLLIAEGLGLLPAYMVDTHVGARGRHDRLMAGLSMLAGVKGIGLDEDTAVEIKDGKATVRGQGVAHVYRRSDEFKSSLPETEEGRMAAVENMIYSIYPAGTSFAL